MFVKLVITLNQSLNWTKVTSRSFPTSFYWGKHPDKQKSLFKILFSQSWSATSPIKKLFKIIFHGRSLVIKFHKPLAIDELKDKGKNTKDNARFNKQIFKGPL